MGIRVEYWEVPTGGLMQTISQEFATFKTWYESIGEEFPNDVDYDILEAFSQVSDDSLWLTQIKPTIVDEFVGTYLGDYCDYGPGKLREVRDTSILNLRNYYRDKPLVDKAYSPAVSQLWGFILHGRSVLPSRSFKVSDENYWHCLFSEAECEIFQQELSANFDTSKPEAYNKISGIGSVIDAIANKSGNGLLITVA